MKKIVLIAVITLLGYAKGYSQLMQSNSLGAVEKKLNIESIPHLNQVANKSDSLIGNKSVETPPGLAKALIEQKNKYNAIAVNNSEISRLIGLVAAANANPAEKKRYEKKIKELGEINNKLQQDIKKQTIEKMGLYDQINNLVIEKYTQYIQELDKELAQYDKEIGKNTTRALSSFDTVIHSSDVNNQHLIDSVSSYMHLNSFIIKQKLDGLKPGRDSVNHYLEELKRLQGDTKKYPSLKESIYLTAMATINKLDSVSAVYKKTVKQSFITDYTLYIVKVNKDIDRLNAIAAKIIKDRAAEASEEEKLAALGGINKIFGDHGAVTPNVSILGQKKFVSKEQSSIYGEVKLIIGANDDNKENTGVNKLFIPEASNFGFMTDFSFGFIGADKKPKFNEEFNHYEQRLGINLGIYYLGKKLQPDTLTNFNTTVFHVKLGIEYVLIPNVLSAYFNTNQLLVTTNIKTFEKYYPEAKRIRSFSSFGVQSYLELNKKAGFFLLINLGFVGVNDDVNTWLNSADSVIPNVKLSLVKNFSF